MKGCNAICVTGEMVIMEERPSAMSKQNSAKLDGIHCVHSTLYRWWGTKKAMGVCESPLSTQIQSEAVLN